MFHDRVWVGVWPSLSVMENSTAAGPVSSEDTVISNTSRIAVPDTPSASVPDGALTPFTVMRELPAMLR